MYELDFSLSFIYTSGINAYAHVFYISRYADIMRVRSQGSSEGVVTRLRVGEQRNGFSIPRRCKIRLSPPKRPDRLWCPRSLLVNGHRCHTSTPPYAFMASAGTNLPLGLSSYCSKTWYWHKYKLRICYNIFDLYLGRLQFNSSPRTGYGHLVSSPLPSVPPGKCWDSAAS